MGGVGLTGQDQTNVLVLAYIEMFLNLFALILFYTFKAQRRFPCAALGWTTVFNILLNLFNISMSNTLSGSPAECKANLLLFSGLGFGLVASNNVFAFILFVTLRLNKSMDYEEDKRYFWGCVGQVVAGCIIMGVVMSNVPYKEAGCTWVVPWLYIPVAVGGFCLLFQLVLISLSLKQVVVIIRKAKGENCSKHDRRLFYLSIRLILVFVLQMFGFFPAYLTEIINVNHLITAFYVKFAGGLSDPIVLTLTNRALMKMIMPKVLHLFGTSSGSSSSGASRTTNISLSTSSGSALPTYSAGGGVSLAGSGPSLSGSGVSIRVSSREDSGL